MILFCKRQSNFWKISNKEEYNETTFLEIEIDSSAWWCILYVLPWLKIILIWRFSALVSKGWLLLYLHLLQRNLKAEGLIVIWVQCVFLHCCLLLLEPLSVLQQVDLHIGICNRCIRSHATLRCSSQMNRQMGLTRGCGRGACSVLQCELVSGAGTASWLCLQTLSVIHYIPNTGFHISRVTSA